MLDKISGRLDRFRVSAGRITPVPFLVRCGVFLAGLLALIVAFPIELLTTRYLVIIATVAIWPMVAPRGRGGTAAALTAVAGWLIDTTAFGAPVALWRVLTLASLLYLAHTFTALAAVLPYDAMVNLEVPARWLGGALVVVLISAVVIVLALGLTADLGGEAFQIATLVGLAAATAVTIVLSSRVRRE